MMHVQNFKLQKQLKLDVNYFNNVSREYLFFLGSGDNRFSFEQGKSIAVLT